MRLRDISFRVFRTLAVTVCLLVVALGTPWSEVAQAVSPVLQRGYDPGVSGATRTETILNTTNVAPSTFGLVFKLPVDDAIFAQPLYVPHVVIPNQGTHNVVYVATMSDTLYAFDADAGGAALWSVNLATLVGATPVPIREVRFLRKQEHRRQSRDPEYSGDRSDHPHHLCRRLHARERHDGLPPACARHHDRRGARTVRES